MQLVKKAVCLKHLNFIGGERLMINESWVTIIVLTFIIAVALIFIKR